MNGDILSESEAFLVSFSWTPSQLFLCSVCICSPEPWDKNTSDLGCCPRISNLPTDCRVGNFSKCQFPYIYAQDLNEAVQKAGKFP